MSPGRVRQGIELVGEFEKVEALPEWGQAVDLQIAAKGKLPLQEQHWFAERSNRSRDLGLADDPSAVTGRVFEATAGRVDVQPIPRIEPSDLRTLGVGEGSLLLGQDPTERLAVSNDQKIV